MSVELYRRKAEDLLRQATQTANMKERGRLIDEAILWHNRAVDARDLQDDRIAGGFDEDGAEARL